MLHNVSGINAVAELEMNLINAPKNKKKGCNEMLIT